MAVFKPHHTMTIIHLLKNAMETGVDLSREEVPQGEKMFLQHANILVPWLWRASQHGVQSEFAQSAVNLLKIFANSDVFVATFPLRRNW
jgi:hypothetical protein